jgi:predicted small metal-binding protein
MTKIVRCLCGFELRDTDEARLIARMQQHAREAHGLELSDEQVRALMEIEQ